MCDTSGLVFGSTEVCSDKEACLRPNDAIVRVHVCTDMHMCMHVCIRVCVKGNMRTTGVSSSEGVAPPSTYRLQGMFSVSPHVCLTRSLLGPH